MSDYIYSISEDLPNGFDTICLHNSIKDYGFSNVFKGLVMDGDTLKVIFSGSLSQSDKDDLDIIISSHDQDNCPEISDVGHAIGIAGDAESLDQSSTNSRNPIQKLRLNISGLISGRYRIGWYYEWSHSSSKYDFRARVQINDSINLMYHSQEAKDRGNDQSVPQCGYAYQNLDDEVYNIDLDYWSENNTSYIQNVRLEIWRVK